MSQLETPLQRSMAEALAQRILGAVEPYVERQLVCGEIRRHHDMVTGITIVLIPKPNEFPYTVVGAIYKQLDQVIVGAQDSSDATIWVKGFPVVLYTSDPEHWGIHVLRFTGPVSYITYLDMVARGQGMVLKRYRGLMRDGELVASRTEEDIFRALGMDYVPPERRDI